MSFRDSMSEILAPLQRRILLMVARAIVKGSDDSKDVQIVQMEGMEDETRDVERLQDYGFFSRPPDESVALVVFLGGDRSAGVMLKADHLGSRLKNIEKGEAGLCTDEGDYLKLARNRELRIRTNKLRVEGASEELMDLLIQVTTEAKVIADKLSTDTVNTILGPMPLNNFASYQTSKANLVTLISKLTAMKA